jgi:carbamoyltransferase
VTEEVLYRMARHVRNQTGMTRLCLAGGVALNCVANGKILREGLFEELWIQPAAGDAGGALGAAYLGWHHYLGRPRLADGRRDAMQGGYLGPAYPDEAIGAYLEREGIAHRKLTPEEVPDVVADLIAREKVVGWFSHRMEFGPRALGARSILGDARSGTMQEVMNLKIKFRESFRPFAPAILKERVADYFELDRESPYMLLVAPVQKAMRRELTAEEAGRFGMDKLLTARSTLPAVTHVDDSARVQTVGPEDHPMFHRLLRRMAERHGCPVVINTSFNVRGEPIVCTPQDAYACFMRTNMDYLLLGTHLLEKDVQKPLDKDLAWLKEFELD